MFRIIPFSTSEVTSGGSPLKRLFFCVWRRMFISSSVTDSIAGSGLGLGEVVTGRMAACLLRLLAAAVVLRECMLAARQGRGRLETEAGRRAAPTPRQSLD